MSGHVIAAGGTLMEFKQGISTKSLLQNLPDERFKPGGIAKNTAL